MTKILWHNLEKEEVIKILRSDFENGLKEEEVKFRQREFGENKLPEEKPISSLKTFFQQFKNPLIYILVIAGIITLFLKEFTNTAVIFGAVLLNTIIGFIQENKTSKILAELKKVIKIKALVIREGNKKEIIQSELVPGDIILLQSGNRVPADGRIIEASNLKINEAFLTGEWIPAEKISNVLPLEISLADRDNMVYMGSLVENGWGKVIITETGFRTEIGKLSQLIKEVKEEKTPYQKKIIYLTRIIGILIVFVSLLIFGLGLILGKDLFEMFLTTVAMAVAAIPEGLPVAITVILTLGMQRILKRQGLVRKMVAAETLGSVSVVCTDKTGTLTEAKMAVAGIYPSSEFIQSPLNQKEKVQTLVLKKAILASEAFIENPEDKPEEWIVRGKPTERVLVKTGIEVGLNKKELEKKQPKIDELLFDPIYKYSASLHKLTDKENILYLLGAPETILEKSKFLNPDNEEESVILQPIEEKKIKKIKRKYEELASQGQRIIAVASQKIPISNSFKLKTQLIKDLVFEGFIALEDPLRKEVKAAIKTCQQAGMKVIIVTGDHKLTARAIAKKLGLPAKEENTIEGLELEKLTDKELKNRLKDIEIYARVEPAHKLRIIKAWQERGKIVAMTGDGINDALALKKADIGIALGSGTEVAKEASDLVLLTDNFSIIEAAVEEGRVIIDNIRKTVTLLASQCFSEIILIGGSIILGLPLPILPTQILWENLIEGSPQGVALAFEPREKGIMKRKPEDPKHPLLTSQMKVIIFGFGIITSLILFVLFLWLLKINLEIAEIRTIIFAALTIDTLFYTFSCKNLRKNLWQYNPFSNLYLVFCVIFSFSMLLLAIYFPFFQNLLKTVPLSFFHWKLILGLGIIHLILIETIKRYFIIKSQPQD